MDRQRSFSLKPTRFLVFSFTISATFLFLIFFSIWVIKSAPSIRQETHLQFNKPSLILGLGSRIVQTNNNNNSRDFSAGGVKNSVLISTHLNGTENTSGSVQLSIFDEIEEDKNKIEEPEDEKYNGNGTTVLDSIAKFPLVDIEVPENVRIEEERIKAASSKKVEPQSEKKAEQEETTSVGKIEILRREKGVEDCDITKGRWVYDENCPLYTNASCPLIDEGFSCESNGRLDRDYMKWRWQPRDCDIPRFNATKMLELIRGKRLVFVGDSINRNQWESMLCLLMGAIRDPRRVYETRGRRITKDKGNYSFRFVDYKCTVEYYVTHFLVHESKARIGRKRVQTLRIDSIDRGSSRWRGADILIFNTAHWWSHYKTKAGINYYQEGDQVHPKLDVSTAFRKALMTWASWVDKHVNRKTKVFFRSSAPSHFRGGQWNSGGHCTEATQPLNIIPGTFYSSKNIIVDEVIKQMRTSVTFLNITSLSVYRIDGHPSVYGRKPGKSYSSGIQDCSHWCLPGVPDTWNELLFFHLLPKRNDHFH